MVYIRHSCFYVMWPSKVLQEYLSTFYLGTNGETGGTPSPFRGERNNFDVGLNWFTWKVKILTCLRQRSVEEGRPEFFKLKFIQNVNNDGAI